MIYGAVRRTGTVHDVWGCAEQMKRQLVGLADGCVWCWSGVGGRSITEYTRNFSNGLTGDAVVFQVQRVGLMALRHG